MPREMQSYSLWSSFCSLYPPSITAPSIEAFSRKWIHLGARLWGRRRLQWPRLPFGLRVSLFALFFSFWEQCTSMRGIALGCLLPGASAAFPGPSQESRAKRMSKGGPAPCSPVPPGTMLACRLISELNTWVRTAEPQMSLEESLTGEWLINSCIERWGSELGEKSQWKDVQFLSRRVFLAQLPFAAAL